MEIKAKDVRVGVSWVMGNAPYQVTLNALSTHIMYLNQGKDPYFDPIPLTEGILLKAGFVKHHTTDEYHSIILPIKCELSNFICISGKDCIIIQGSDEITLAPIKYVHQLQNLFFSLCGKELNLDLSK